MLLLGSATLWEVRSLSVALSLSLPQALGSRDAGADHELAACPQGVTVCWENPSEASRDGDLDKPTHRDSLLPDEQGAGAPGSGA